MLDVLAGLLLLVAVEKRCLDICFFSLDKGVRLW
jgi:hypothetical protein